LRQTCTDGASRIYNPAIALVHELFHLTHPDYGVTGPNDDPQYQNKEEKRVITGPEAQVYEEIYHIKSVRADHGSNDNKTTPWRTFQNPTSMTPIKDSQ
jgi:hypothetical protein